MRADRPNIVLVFVDNQPAKMLGCAGNSEISTPNLDKLARHASRFTEAYCPNAMCSPCRASVLTGLMPSQHGVHTWIDDSCSDTWPEQWNSIKEFDTIPEILGRQGYDTALIGKYHLGVADHPQNGFDHWTTFQIGHIQSFHDYEIIENDKKFIHRGHIVDFLSRRAAGYILDHASEDSSPFFLFLTYPAPYGHWPAIRGEPENEFAELYRETPFASIPREGISDALIDWVLLRNEKLPKHDFQGYRDLLRIPNDLPTLRNYYSQMSILDKGVGHVLETLETTSLLGNTLVIYTSDHGMSLGEHGFWGHGEDTWPSNTHREANNVPLIIRPPGGRRRPQELGHLVGTIDIFSTILDYAGISAESFSARPSRSLKPLVESGNFPGGNCVFMEQEETRAVRTSGWLYMRRFAAAPYFFGNQLYDLANDPNERVNLAGKPEYAAVEAALVEKIDTYFARYSDAKWNLWQGGSVKSNSSRPFFWKEVWGEDWQPKFQVGIPD